MIKTYKNKTFEFAKTKNNKLIPILQMYNIEAKKWVAFYSSQNAKNLVNKNWSFAKYENTKKLHQADQN